MLHTSQLTRAAGILVVATLWIAGVGELQTQSLADVEKPSNFEVVSVKPNRTGSGTTVQRIQPSFSFENVTLKTLILFAYDVPAFLVTGGPDWVNADKFDFAGVNPPGTTPSISETRTMVRGALAERFRLKVRREVKTQPTYSLVLSRPGRMGDHLTPASVDCIAESTPRDVKRDSLHCGLQFERASIAAHGRRLDILTNYLRSVYLRVVFDKTGLQGPFDFDLKWNRDLAADSQFPSLEGALQEQLGLKLQAGESAVETLVIDEVLQPTAD